MARYERLNLIWQVIRDAERPLSSLEIAGRLAGLGITTTPETVQRDLEMHYEVCELAGLIEGKWQKTEGTR